MAKRRAAPCSALGLLASRPGLTYRGTDFVYELRRRADYEHVDEYTADTGEAAMERFHDGVLFLVDSGLLVIEAQVAAHIGIDAYRSAAAEWTARTDHRLGGWASSPVQRRVETVAAQID
jgi:hypothetical protein